MIFKKLFNKGGGEDSAKPGSSLNKTGKGIEHSAFQVNSAINGQMDVAGIFEFIGRESARCLKANRSTVFLVDGAKSGVKTQYTYSPERLDEKPGFLVEREIARRVIAEKKPILLREPKDLSEFFKYEERGRKITSLLSIPFGFQGKVVGTLNSALINGRRAFNENDLQLLSVFASHASMALENQYLLEEVRKAATLRKSYEEHLDELMKQLQGLSQEERRRIDDHIGRFLADVKAEKPAEPMPTERASGGKGIISLAGEAAFEDSPENLAEKVQVEVEELGGRDLSRAGIFIPTANPRDLGEQFTLRLYLPEGQPLEVPCKVIFSNKYGKESQNLRRGMGIKFLDLPPEVQKQLEERIQASKQAEAFAEPEPTKLQPAKNGREEEHPDLSLKPTTDLN